MKIPTYLWILCWLCIGFALTYWPQEKPPPLRVCHGWEEVDIKEVTAYAYDMYPGPTAYGGGTSGIPGWTVAHRLGDPTFKPGDVIKIEGWGVGVISDNGPLFIGDSPIADLDIMTATIPEALKWGRQRRKVWKSI